MNTEHENLRKDFKLSLKEKCNNQKESSEHEKDQIKTVDSKEIGKESAIEDAKQYITKNFKEFGFSDIGEDETSKIEMNVSFDKPESHQSKLAMDSENKNKNGSVTRCSKRKYIDGMGDENNVEKHAKLET